MFTVHKYLSGKGIFVLMSIAVIFTVEPMETDEEQDKLVIVYQKIREKAGYVSFTAEVAN